MLSETITSCPASVGGANTFDTEGNVAGAAVVVVLSPAGAASAVVVEEDLELLQAASEVPARQNRATPNPSKRGVLSRGLSEFEERNIGILLCPVSLRSFAEHRLLLTVRHAKSQPSRGAGFDTVSFGWQHMESLS